MNNYRCIIENIKNLSSKYGTQPPRLLAVTKSQSIEDILLLYNLGQIHFGENRVQDLVDKAPMLPNDIKWHFIGKLQSNKCKQLAKIDNLYLVESLDSEYIASELNKYLNRDINVYIQINTSKEESKNGIPFDNERAIFNLIKYIINDCKHLNFKGLMTIGDPDLEKCEFCFSKMPKLIKLIEFFFPKIGALEVSMGMSNDYHLAIKENATQIRLGRCLFNSSS